VPGAGGFSAAGAGLTAETRGNTAHGAGAWRKKRISALAMADSDNDEGRGSGVVAR
jgi:hypothetical protein